jgi:dTDP-4-dehydrorhamnose 3,5-epimerase
MKFHATPLDGLVFIEPTVYSDERGFFMETFHGERFRAHGLPDRFVQDNHSCSAQGAVRGLHYQIEHAQGKLVRVVRGAIFDVAVDLRRNSPNFGSSFGLVLSDVNRRQLYVPPGFAHGFCALSDGTEVTYKCTDLYHPQHERTLLWNDPELRIDWPVARPILSEKDKRGLPLCDAPCYDEPPSGIGCATDGHAEWQAPALAR